MASVMTWSTEIWHADIRLETPKQRKSYLLHERLHNSISTTPVHSSRISLSCQTEPAGCPEQGCESVMHLQFASASSHPVSPAQTDKLLHKLSAPLSAVLCTFPIAMRILPEEPVEAGDSRRTTTPSCRLRLERLCHLRLLLELVPHARAQIAGALHKLSGHAPHHSAHVDMPREDGAICGMVSTAGQVLCRHRPTS